MIASAFVALVVLVLVLVARRLPLVPLAVWLAVTALAALSGFLSHFEAVPPRLLFVLVGSTVLFVVLIRRQRAALMAMPLAWPIALQTMRVGVELVLFALHREGLFPTHLTFEGRNFDVLVGLTAPLVAWVAIRHRGVLIAWNIAGLLLLANIVAMAVTTLPGPLHHAWPGVPSTIVTTWPYVWLPGFLVPVALFSHVVSLLQLFSWKLESPAR